MFNTLKDGRKQKLWNIFLETLGDAQGRASGGAGDSICHNCDFFVTDLNPGVSRVPWELLTVEKQKQKTFKPDLSSRARQVLLCIPFKER